MKYTDIYVTKMQHTTSELVEDSMFSLQYIFVLFIMALYILV